MPKFISARNAGECFNKLWKSSHLLTWLRLCRVLPPFLVFFYRADTAQSMFLLRPTTLSCHSSTVLDDLHPPVLRPCSLQSSASLLSAVSRSSGDHVVMRGAFDVRAHRTFVEASSWSWWRQPHPLAVAPSSADRTYLTEGGVVFRDGSNRFDNVASFIPSCTGTWQDSSCQLHSAKTANMQSGVTSTGSSVFFRIFSLFHVGWTHVELMWASDEKLRGISSLYPLAGLYKIR